MTKREEDLSFEKSFERLEHILEILNSSHPSLEEALKLYEEADGLIIQCHKKLSSAEKKIEVLIKNRNGELQLNAEQKPLTQEMQ
jgi:exodeoxyribonuclease VII small subunit